MKIVPILPTDVELEKTCEVPAPSRTPAILSLSFVVLAWLANEVALAWIHERVPRDTHPLPDIWFDIFPEIPGAIRVTENIMLVIVLSAFVVVFCHQHRWIVMSRVFFCVALCYAFRAFFITIFQVPVPSLKTYCAPKTEGGFRVIASRVFKIFWSAGIEQFRARELCGDLIVSGHTLSLYNAVFTFKQYAPRKLNLISQIYHVAAIVAIICVLLARKHYTVDVLLGYFVASRIFWTYHSLQNSFHNKDLENNALNQSFWSSVVPFIERDAPPPSSFKNHLEWPSSCPQTIRRRWI